MLGSGFIPLIMAYEYIKNRAKYPQEYFIIAVSYLISMPTVFYDYFIFSHRQGTLNFLFHTPGIIPFLNRFIVFVSGTFLFVKGLQEIYHIIKKIYDRKYGGQEDV